LARHSPIAWLAAGLLSLTPSFAAAAIARPGDEVDSLREYSLEDLTNLEVTSVSKRAEPLNAAPASIYVITADDIRRSGATSLPEALRLAPNLEVARINGFSYAITARGMNSAESANKLLVLINGRSVYEPIGSGVLWQQVDVVLSTIERIEVISGAGGTLYGANAVNGVINVITRNTRDIAGFAGEFGGGTLDRNASVRYGGTWAAGTYGVALAAFERRGLDRVTAGDSSVDRFEGINGKVRLDGGGAAGAYAVIADLYSNRADGNNGDQWGGSLLGRVNRTLGDGSTVEVQAYVARDDRTGIDLKEKRDTYNLQAQHAITLGANQLVWGGEYRVWREYFLSTNLFQFARPRATISLGSLFVQDVVAIRPNVKLTLGIKLEDNSYSGLDWLPNVRLAWTPTANSLVWGSAARAVRTPNRIERELQASGVLVPAPDFGSESVWTYEVGYRLQPSPQASVSVTAFYSHYKDLRITEFVTFGAFPLILKNGAAGGVYGVEGWGVFDPRPWWRLKAGFTILRRDINNMAGHLDLSSLQVAGLDPRYQGQIRSTMALSPVLDLDVGLRRVGRLTTGTSAVNTPAYTEADARLAWRIGDRVEMALVGANLLHRRHIEIDDRTTAPVRAIPRSVHAELRWGF
jgi:iron complex outermembrane receptor protein